MEKILAVLQPLDEFIDPGCNRIEKVDARCITHQNRSGTYRSLQSNVGPGRTRVMEAAKLPESTPIGAKT
jgi:hypothetical protein